MPARYRALILLTTFASLRFGEVTALERGDIDLKAGTVRVRRAHVEVRGRGLVAGPPKSRAGVRTVSIPTAIVEVVCEHLAEHSNTGPLVFTGTNGAALRRGNFNQLVKCRKTVSCPTSGSRGCGSTTCGTRGTRSRRAAGSARET